MKPKINILVREPNQYFAAGLTQGLLMHAKAIGLLVRITDNTLEKSHADVVFFAAEYALSCGYLGSRRTGPAHQQVILIKQKPQLGDTAQFYGVSGILYRHERLEQACQLATHAWQHTEAHPQDDAHPALTPQETTVLRYLAQGITHRAIGQALCINTKTVSTHKRNAMAKLHMVRTPDLIYWLLRGGLDSLPAHRLPLHAMKQKPITLRQPQTIHFPP
jgi:DNA-binding CsgD family transcriptional regulator